MAKKRKNTSTVIKADSKLKESAHDSSSKSLNNGKSVLEPCSWSKANLKKQKIHKEKSEENDEDEKIDLKSEIKKLKKSMKELFEDMKELLEILPINGTTELQRKPEDLLKKPELKQDDSGLRQQKSILGKEITGNKKNSTGMVQLSNRFQPLDSAELTG